MNIAVYCSGHICSNASLQQVYDMVMKVSRALDIFLLVFLQSRNGSLVS